MKKIILISLLTIIISTNVCSQYRPMITEGSVWNHYVWFEASCNQELIVKGDSIINNKTYKIIANEGDQCNYGDNLLIRENAETKKIFARGIDSIDVLLYDFSLQKGDTAIIGYESFTLVLDSIKTILPSISCDEEVPEILIPNPKIFYLRNLNYPGDRNIIWVEGIGNIADPFMTTISWDAGFLGNALLCHFDDQNIRDYHYVFCEEPSPCEGPVMSTEDLDDTPKESVIDISPNPSSGLVYIQSKIKITEIAIYNSIGKMTYENRSPETYNIDISNLPPGIYILKLKTSNNQFIAKQIVKI